MKFPVGDGSHNTPAVQSGYFCDTRGLETWENILKERKKIHQRLCEKLRRQPGELLMNASDELRHVKEDKLILEYTKIPQHFDKYRGNPAFWKLPTGLIDKCDPTLDPVYFTVPTKEEKNEIPQLEYVTVPDYVKGEKDLLPRVRNLYETWRSSRYRQQKSMRVSRKIEFIEPHKPQLEEVIVVGQRISYPAPSIGSASSGLYEPETFSSMLDEKSTDDSKLQCEEIPRIRFIINGVTFSDVMIYPRVPVISMDFTYDVTTKMILTKHLILENTGRVTVYLSWNRKKKFDLFKDIKLQPTELPCFLFDINDIILIPNQRIRVPIMIRPILPISFSETWMIRSNPKVSDDGFYIVLKLSYNGFTRGLDAEAENIQYILDLRAKNNVIKEVIKDIFISLKYYDKLFISLKYSEEQLFEAVNYSHSPFVSEPHYVYNEQIIQKLKNFYYEVRGESDPEEWNLCIKDLRELARAKDLSLYLEKISEKTITVNDKIAELEKIRQEFIANKLAAKVEGETKKKKGKKDKGKKSSKSKKSKSKSSGSKKSKGKNKGKKKKAKSDKSDASLKQAPAKTKSHLIGRSYRRDLARILEQLQKPAMKKNVERLKYFNVYSVLCSYISKICQSVETLQRNIFHNKLENQFFPCHSLQERPDRLIYEYFDDTLSLSKSEKIPLQGYPSKPAPKADSVKDIPEDNVDELYRAYFGDDREESKVKGKKKGKKGKGKKNKGSKSSKSSKSSKASKGSKKSKAKKKAPKTSDKKSQSNVVEERLDFDPFAEETSPKKSEIAIVSETAPQPLARSAPSVALSSVSDSIWQQNLYVTFYAYLCEAVDVMMEICDQFINDTASPLLVREAKKHSLKDHQLKGRDYNELIDDKIPYPPQETDIEKDEYIKTYLIKETVRPTKPETRAQTSLWSLLQYYTPYPTTPPEIIPTPEPSIVEEPKTKEMEIQALPLPEDDELVEKYLDDGIKSETSGASDRESPIEFHYYYLEEDDPGDESI